ncbi:MAG: caspase family protein [Pseudomonadota bacterium]|nr:caspase family protein [Pseudomonadota bacterium]
MLIVPGISETQPLGEQVLYAENFKDNLANDWELESGWVVDGGALVGEGHKWARYRDGHWGDGRLIVSFKLRKLAGVVHANVLVSETGRYAVSLHREPHTNRLRVVLFKQLWPDTFFNDLAIAEIKDYGSGIAPEIAIVSEGGFIEVLLDGRTILHYQDPSPLPPGTIAFETLDGSSAQVDDIIVTGALPAGPVVDAKPGEIRLRMQAAIPVEFPIAGTLAPRLADLVNQRAGGEVRIDLFGSGDLFPVKESLSAVQEGIVDAAFGFSALLFRDVPAAQLLAGMPFSAEPRRHYDWLRQGHSRSLYEEYHTARGVKGIPCGLIGPEGFWSRRPLNEPGDFRGLNARSVGFAAKVFAKLGVLVESVAPKSVALALGRGELGAAELSAPYVDAWFGILGNAGYYYYYPSWHQPVGVLEVLLSERSWHRLAARQQEMLENLCHDITLESISEDERRAPRALREIEVRGAKVLEWSTRIREVAQAAWESIAEEEMRENTQFRRVYQAYRDILPASHKTEVASRQPQPEKKPAQKVESLGQAHVATPVRLPALEIEPLDQPYAAIKNANVRERPDVRSKRIDSLRAGEKVTALGKVAGRNWHLVARKGEEIGYVYGALLAPVTPVLDGKAAADFKATVPAKDGTGPTILLDRTKIETSSAQVEISGTLQDESSVRKLSINGALADFSTRDGSFRVIRRVEPGETKLRLAAKDEWGNRSEATVVVVRTTPAKGPAAQPRKTGARLGELGAYGKKYAVIIGISEYKSLPEKPSGEGGLADLKYAAKDAQAFEGFLNTESLSGGGWYIFSLYNEQATRQAVHYKLTEVLRTKARRGDLVYIFFSGHGRGHELWPEDVYLLTHDFDPKNYASGLSYDRLQTLINESPSEHVVTFVDACRSGVIGFGKAVDARGSFNQSIFGKRLRELGGKENKAIFSAGSADQISFEDDDIGHGVFTHFLIEGLRGKAPENGKYPQTVDLIELERYVSEKVLDYTRRHPKLQTQFPKVQGTYSENFPVALRESN